MKKAVFHSAFCILHSALILFVLVPPCAAQRDTGIPYGQRTDAFRRLLFEFRFQPLTEFKQLWDKPDETVLIVLGDPSCLSRDFRPGELVKFVKRGGAVLIATDRETKDSSLSQLAGVVVSGDILTCTSRNPADLYSDSMYCPFVQPIEDSGRPASVLGALAAVVGAGGRPALFRNPHPGEPDLRVATNAPSHLRERHGLWGLPGGIQRLARLPAGCQEEIPPGRWTINRELDQQESPLFAVGGTVGEGRVLVLADHSIFINRMILPRDNGNLEFTANCLHWLRGGAMSVADLASAARDARGIPQLTGQRDKALFYDDNQIRTNFEVPLKAMPVNPSLGSEPAIIAAVDQTLANLEDSNALNRELLDQLAEWRWPPTRLARAALYLLTLGLLLFLGYQCVWRVRYRLDLAVPSLAKVVTQHEPKTSLLEQRRRAMLRVGNVWETAHELARQCFESADIPLTGASAPRIITQGSWWRRWRISRRVGRLWELARGTAPARIPPAALKRWLRELEELKTALEQGTLRLQNDE